MSKLIEITTFCEEHLLLVAGGYVLFVCMSLFCWYVFIEVTKD